MATTPQNLIHKTETSFVQLPNNAGNVIHSGDAVYVDTNIFGNTYDIKALDTDAHAKTFAGISQDTYDPTNYGVYANDPVPPVGMMVQREGVWYPYTTSGETYYPGEAVYISTTNAQTITKTSSNSNAIGYINDDPLRVNVGLIGNGTNQIEVMLARVWPASSV